MAQGARQQLLLGSGMLSCLRMLHRLGYTVSPIVVCLLTFAHSTNLNCPSFSFCTHVSFIVTAHTLLHFLSANAYDMQFFLPFSPLLLLTHNPLLLTLGTCVCLHRIVGSPSVSLSFLSPAREEERTLRHATLHRSRRSRHAEGL